MGSFNFKTNYNCRSQKYRQLIKFSDTEWYTEVGYGFINPDCPP
jgi:hypothetical protein